MHPKHTVYHVIYGGISSVHSCGFEVQWLCWEKTYQVLAGHLTDAHHPDCIWRYGLIVKGCVHEGAGAGRRSLIVFRCHRIMGLQERLQAELYKGYSDVRSYKCSYL